ncbi:MAG TPA: alpha/beta fold hydrolase [Actinomycetota bacterium]|nr:alpha/beta fold hydrolase [Actinomycetota bacterium]
MRRRHLPGLLALSVALTALVGAGPSASAAPQHVSVKSFDGTEIWISIYKPADATAEEPVPVILQSHGWGGSRTTSPTAFGAWLEEGFGVVSIDQRGHGQTGGTAHVQNPDYEARDIIAVIDHVATLDWVQLDGPGDPVMGAIGGSYGGGYQMITSLTEVLTKGSTRFNALAPQITWYDLPRSLGPSDVPRTLWNTLLYAAGASRLPDYVHRSYALGVATATFPNGEIPETYNLKERFYNNSPAWFVDQEVQLDIPLLVGQGTSDNLFPLNEGWDIFSQALTDDARERSLFIGYNGGHALPQALPLGSSSGADACSGGFDALSRAFFKRAFAGEDTRELLRKQVGITTATGQCLWVDTLEPSASVELGTLAAPTAVGAPISYEIASGPMTIAGVPVLLAKVTSAAPEARAFFALSVGTSPANATVLQNNVMPMRLRLPKLSEAFSLELAGVAATLTEGQKLYLTVSPTSDMFIGTSRVPSVVLLEDAVVDLPVR